MTSLLQRAFQVTEDLDVKLWIAYTVNGVVSGRLIPCAELTYNAQSGDFQIDVQPYLFQVFDSEMQSEDDLTLDYCWNSFLRQLAEMVRPFPDILADFPAPAEEDEY